MKLLTKEDLRAALFASLISAPVFWFGGYFFNGIPILGEDWWLVFVGPIFWEVFTYPIALAGLLFLGMPCHALLRYFSINSYLLLGLLGAPLMVGFHEIVFINGEYDQITILFISCGAGVSAMYAALSKKFNKVHQSE